MKLPSVFADNALFMGGSDLEIQGVAKSDSVVNAAIRSGEKIFSTAETVADCQGNFRLVLKCPESSFERFEIVLDDGEETVLKNILFGELWLASGQSNMEMPNGEQPDFPEYLEGISFDTVRTYRIDTSPASDNFPYEPSDSKFGEWSDLTREDKLVRVSAVATVFAGKLFNILGRKVPVGIVDSSVGGSLIENWLPRAEVENDPQIKKLMGEKNRIVPESEWNTKGEGNASQAFALYNDKTASVLGLKFRGLLWYQGESNNGDGPDYYLALYKFMQSVYSEKFGFDKERFPIISSLIYPWDYGIDAPARMNLLNEAFILATDENPDLFSFVTIYDLSPIWTCWHQNHPIHPAHKYHIGVRMANVAKSMVYGFDGAKSPAYMESFEVVGDRIRVKFKNVSRGLYCKGDILKGFNICGENRVYAPAKAVITGKDTIEIYSEHISEPIAAAYNYSDYDISGNLFAGDMPVASFLINDDISAQIRLKPWLDLNNETAWVLTHSKSLWETYCFSIPVWSACENSIICHDPVFMGQGKTLRIISDSDSFGAYVASHHYYELDLYRYEKIIVKCFSARDNLSAWVDFEIENGETVENVRFDGNLKSSNSKGFKTFEFDISSMEKCDIQKLAFKFKVADGFFSFVNICDIDIIPKK